MAERIESMFDEYKDIREDNTQIGFCANQWNKSITMYFKEGTYKMDGNNVVVTIKGDKLLEAVLACMKQFD